MAGDKNTVKVWDTQSRKEVLSLPVPGFRASMIGFAPDGSNASSYSIGTRLKDGIAGIMGWVNSSTNKKQTTGDFYPMEVILPYLGLSEENIGLKTLLSGIVGVCFDEKARKLCVGFKNGAIVMVELREGFPGKASGFEGHKQAVVSVRFSPDGEHIVSGSLDGTVKKWGMQDRRTVSTVTIDSDRVSSLSLSADCKRVAWGSDDGTITVRELPWGGEQHEEHTGSVRCAEFSPEGERVIFGSTDRTLRMWELDKERKSSKFAEHDGAVTGARFSPDGRWIISTSEDRRVKVWAVATRREAFAFEGPEGELLAAFSRDGNWLASRGDGDVKVRDSLGRVIDSVTTETAEPVSLTLGAEGTHLIVGDTRGTLRVRHCSSRQTIHTINKSHTGPIHAVAASPDGKRILTGGEDGQVRLWDVLTGVEVLSFKGSHSPVRAVCFSPDGNRIFAGSDDGIVRVWDALPR